jgi:predicted short-subunit dehydrogenase-like oxidoreductase (DUF2520 family)
MKISFIGSGNVAWHLSQVFEDNGHFICEVYSRQLSHARALVGKLFDSKAVTSLEFSKSEAELFVLAVKDDAISQVLTNLKLPKNAIIVHTSGSKSIDLLIDFANENFDLNIKVGVFYPLMTFSKSKKLNFLEVPLCIEATEEETEILLVKLGQQVSNIVYLVNTDERKILHLAAVFACNFTNHLLAITQDILLDHDLEFALLKPIIRETFYKALNTDDIHEVQTGPARRADQKTIKSQIELLKSNPQAEKIYRVLSESILNQFNPY